MRGSGTNGTTYTRLPTDRNVSNPIVTDCGDYGPEGASQYHPRYQSTAEMVDGIWIPNAIQTGGGGPCHRKQRKRGTDMKRRSEKRGIKR